MSGRTAGIEELRALFADQRVHIGLAVIKRVEVAKDRSAVRCIVSLLPESREIVATLSWEDCGEEAGIYCLPQPNDTVLVAMAEGNIEQTYVIRRLSSREDKVPLQAVSGDMALVAKDGKKVWITSATRINLSKGTGTPSQNLVLGQVLKTLLSDVLTAIIGHTHISGAPGFPTSPPVNAAEFTAKKANPVDNSAILSDIAFTEKGT